MDLIAQNAIVRTVEVAQVVTQNGVVVQETRNIAISVFRYAVESPVF